MAREDRPEDLFDRDRFVQRTGLDPTTGEGAWTGFPVEGIPNSFDAWFDIARNASQAVDIRDIPNFGPSGEHNVTQEEFREEAPGLLGRRKHRPGDRYDMPGWLGKTAPFAEFSGERPIDIRKGPGEGIEGKSPFHSLETGDPFTDPFMDPSQVGGFRQKWSTDWKTAQPGMGDSESDFPAEIGEFIMGGAMEGADYALSPQSQTPLSTDELDFLAERVSDSETLSRFLKFPQQLDEATKRWRQTKDRRREAEPGRGSMTVGSARPGRAMRFRPPPGRGFVYDPSRQGYTRSFGTKK